MVLRYAVLGLKGRYAPDRRVKSTNFSNRKCARSGPCARNTESMDSSHSWVSTGSISSNGDCCVIECTHPRVLIRWQARYSAAALTATEFALRLSSGFGFSRSSKGLDRDTFAVLRYADSLALRPTPRAGAPDPRPHYPLGSGALRERLAVFAARPNGRGLAG